MLVPAVYLALTKKPEVETVEISCPFKGYTCSCCILLGQVLKWFRKGGGGGENKGKG